MFSSLKPGDPVKVCHEHMGKVIRWDEVVHAVDFDAVIVRSQIDIPRTLVFPKATGRTASEVYWLQIEPSKDERIAVLEGVIRDIHWMARRYADGRKTYAPGMFNRAIERCLGVGLELDGKKEGLWAGEGARLAALDKRQEPPEGERVITAPELGDRDFSKEAIKNRKPNAHGVIVGRSDSHGLCYKVQHEDGTIAYYDPDEIEIL